MADPTTKRVAHWLDLRDAIDAGAQYRLGDLLTMPDYPASERLGVFYGQSLSLIEFLADAAGDQSSSLF